ncbi:DUF3347 domain-containing protein [Myroides sp. N17-2]|uniref:DUF3347 domain-containing protein n=1 Tax=Myroides sp. N17-2 TaxID=2030799 RepID=UPI000EFAA157|nr:DUF3347 domain-containing protein [Myroides sp. N17-2]
MKHLFLGLITFTALVLTGCNNKQTTQNNEENSVSTTTIETAVQKTDFSQLFAHYEQLINALATDSDKDAANAAKGMLVALKDINSTGLTAEQKSMYDDIMPNIQENAEHIADNIGNIAHQREHLIDISTDIYDIAKLFGTSKPYYKVFCPMYNDKKGAFWLSENKEYKNPYMGSRMSSCGEIQEELK